MCLLLSPKMAHRVEVPLEPPISSVVCAGGCEEDMLVLLCVYCQPITQALPLCQQTVIKVESHWGGRSLVFEVLRIDLNRALLSNKLAVPTDKLHPIIQR